MAQHDYVIANASGATVRADINSALSAIQTLNSGTSAPSSTAAGMLWLDTTGGAPYALKVRDAGNNHWLTLASVTDPGSDGNIETSATIKGTIDSSATFPAGHVISIKAVTLENTAITTSSTTYQAVSQLDLSINRTSGTHLFYFLQGGGGFNVFNGRSIYVVIRRTDGTSYSSTNETNLSGADDHGHMRIYSGSEVITPYSIMAYDNASVSGNKTYRTFYKSNGDTVDFQNTDRGMITATIMEFIPST
jgi:hypothetical protein